MTPAWISSGGNSWGPGDRSVYNEEVHRGLGTWSEYCFILCGLGDNVHLIFVDEYTHSLVISTIFDVRQCSPRRIIRRLSTHDPDLHLNHSPMPETPRGVRPLE